MGACALALRPATPTTGRLNFGDTARRETKILTWRQKRVLQRPSAWGLIFLSGSRGRINSAQAVNSKSPCAAETNRAKIPLTTARFRLKDVRQLFISRWADAQEMSAFFGFHAAHQWTEPAPISVPGSHALLNTLSSF